MMTNAIPPTGDYIRDFLLDSRENVAELDNSLVRLEKSPTPEILSIILRALHTLKGSSGMLGFSRIEALAHSSEALLVRVRDGALSIRQEIVSAILAAVDAMRATLASIESTGAEGDARHERLLEMLQRLQAPSEAQVSGADSSAAASSDSLDLRLAPSETGIRVDVNLLDTLMNRVGELVLARNQILQLTAASRDPLLAATAQRLSLITSELQEGVMKTRMQPINTVWSLFPRVVRDLALECGKKVRLELDGEGTELDRTIIEAIKAPLTHIVRNAIDHGIEPAAARVAARKSEEGLLRLSAFHEGGQVKIEVNDDGAGIDVERIRRKAIAQDRISPEQAARMSDREALNLIFLPGFTTAESVTHVSGRGVGMDVVRTNIEKIGGIVDIESQAGRGTSIRIKIPLTLAIIPALIVDCGGDRFAIPQVNLLELVRLEGESVRTRIERVHSAPVCRLRGHLLPLVDLAQELGGAGVLSRADLDEVNIAVLQADGRPFGLVVDSVNDTEDIVVKPMGRQLKGIAIYAGATIMGDGRVALILDALGLAQWTRVIAPDRQKSVETAAATKREDARTDNVRTLLLLEDRDGGRLAVPLSLVARLEEFPRSAVERSGGRDVVQYRGRILPLIHLAGFLARRNDTAAESAASLSVVVYAGSEGSVGLVVERVVDIMEESLEIQCAGHRAGVMGSAILQGRITEILDLEGILKAAAPELAGAASASAELE